MFYPLSDQIEDLSSKTIGDLDYHGKKLVLLDDAIGALEELETKLWALCQIEIDKKAGVLHSNY